MRIIKVDRYASPTESSLLTQREIGAMELLVKLTSDKDLQYFLQVKLQLHYHYKMLKMYYYNAKKERFKILNK